MSQCMWVCFMCVCVLCISFALGHTHSEYAYPYSWHFWLLLFVVNGKNVCLKCLIYVHADREHFIAFVVPVRPLHSVSYSVCSLAQSCFDIRTASIPYPFIFVYIHAADKHIWLINAKQFRRLAVKSFESLGNIPSWRQSISHYSLSFGS